MSYTLQINGTVIFLPFHFKFATKMSDSRTSEYLGRTLDDNKTLLLSFVWVDSIVNNFCCLGCWKENLPLILLLLILYQSYLIGVRFSILLNMPCLCVYVWYLLFSCLFSDFFFAKNSFFFTTCDAYEKAMTFFIICTRLLFVYLWSWIENVNHASLIENSETWYDSNYSW